MCAPSADPAPSRPAGGPAPLERREVGSLHPGGLRQGAPVEHEEERIEEEEEPGTAGVDDAGLGQHRQHLGRAGQRVGRLVPRTLHDAHEAGPVGGAHGGGGGDGEDGPFDGPHHRPPGQVGGMGHGIDQEIRPHAGLPGGRHALAHPPQELGQDHARVPPGPHQRAVPDGLADLVEARLLAHVLQLGDHGLQGQGHVRARVPVGHRVDVQAVDIGLVQPQRIPVPPHHGAEVNGAEGRRGGHGRGC